eukprot:scaffold4747_cov99-Isochrysis_galbana.AAC.10
MCSLWCWGIESPLPPRPCGFRPLPLPASRRTRFPHAPCRSRPAPLTRMAARVGPLRLPDLPDDALRRVLSACGARWVGRLRASCRRLRAIARARSTRWARWSAALPDYARLALHSARRSWRGRRPTCCSGPATWTRGSWRPTTSSGPAGRSTGGSGPAGAGRPSAGSRRSKAGARRWLDWAARAGHLRHGAASEGAVTRGDPTCSPGWSGSCATRQGPALGWPRPSGEGEGEEQEEEVVRQPASDKRCSGRGRGGGSGRGGGGGCVGGRGAGNSRRAPLPGDSSPDEAVRRRGRVEGRRRRGRRTFSSYLQASSLHAAGEAVDVAAVAACLAASTARARAAQVVMVMMMSTARSAGST